MEKAKVKGKSRRDRKSKHIEVSQLLDKFVVDSNSRLALYSPKLAGGDCPETTSIYKYGCKIHIYRMLRMKETFTKLCQWFRKNGRLTDSREIKIKQQVAQFLLLVEPKKPEVTQIK
jgi:hypothetical protein